MSLFFMGCGSSQLLSVNSIKSTEKTFKVATSQPRELLFGGLTGCRGADASPLTVFTYKPRYAIFAYAIFAYAILAYTDLDCKLSALCQFGPTVEKSIYTQQYGLFLATLRAARESAGIPQSELAARLDVDQPFVSKCESGQRRLDFIEVREWCAALGITLNELTVSFEETIARTQKK
ncbi:helix-turn-helix domain-containing protein [Paraburkholderia sp. RL17-337-BIB-A]|uniref:helix-turn-helix domain-containing protein n=1 Tax=Paraburkholderia sp. RL17-337-BIB-A TaxID=3031636 RepID=UPI0038B73B24